MARDLTDASALQAIDVVCGRWPTARWVTDGECGRVVVGPDDFLSERFSLLDDLTEHRALFQAAGWALIYNSFCLSPGVRSTPRALPGLATGWPVS